jgi:prepilin-type processing-associated H-X9-DG protein
MNASSLLDLALNQLDDDEAVRAIRELEADPALSHRLARLSASLTTLLDDDDRAYEPPPNLARRTLAFVEAESRARRPPVLEFHPGRMRFRREDLAIAATIFLASLLALAPAVLRGRERWGRAACQSNLQRVGMRLHQYAAINHAYPFVSADDEVPHVGTIICRLNDAGFAIQPSDLQCPCSGSKCAKGGSIPHLSQVAETMKVSPEEGCKMIGANDYAFNIGNYASPALSVDPRAKAVPLSALASHAIPIVADRPAFHAGEVLQGNSPNHGGQGQNVLFADGHSAWHNTRRVSPVDNDIYLNDFNRPAYGIGLDDAVLMPAVFKVQAH